MELALHDACAAPRIESSGFDNRLISVPYACTKQQNMRGTKQNTAQIAPLWPRCSRRATASSHSPACLSSCPRHHGTAARRAARHDNRARSNGHTNLGNERLQEGFEVARASARNGRQPSPARRNNTRPCAHLKASILSTPSRPCTPTARSSKSRRPRPAISLQWHHNCAQPHAPPPPPPAPARQ